MRPNPKPQEMYRHFKGNIYQIRCLARHSETGEQMVVYQAMYDTFQIYVRPLSMFMDEVDRTKYPDAKQTYRFELLQDLEDETESGPVQGTAVPTASARQETPAAAPAQQPAASTAQARQATASTAPARQAAPAAPIRQTAEEQVNIDPQVMEFLDADTYEQRLTVLASLRHRITDDMINTMAAAIDLEIKDGDVAERYEEFKNCLLTFKKYECSRLR